MFLPGLPKTGGECGCIEGKGTVQLSSGGPVNAGPINGSKTAHTKVAASGSHASQQAPSKRASSGADGDYQLVQHEVLYSLSAEYEVRAYYISRDDFYWPVTVSASVGNECRSECTRAPWDGWIGMCTETVHIRHHYLDGISQIKQPTARSTQSTPQCGD